MPVLLIHKVQLLKFYQPDFIQMQEQKYSDHDNVASR